MNIASAAAAQHYRREGLSFVRIRDIEPATILLVSAARPANAAVAMFTSIAKDLAASLSQRTVSVGWRVVTRVGACRVVLPTTDPSPRSSSRSPTPSRVARS